MIKNLNTDMLVFIGIGDAYALAAEYLKDNSEHLQKVKEFSYYQAHPKHQQVPGTYSDDCEMSCGVAHVLVENNYPFTQEQFADAWVAEFIRGGRRKGYSQAFQAIMDKCETGQDLIDNVSPTSEKNGACMRAVPVGVIKDISQLLDTAELQASVTHNTFPAIFSAKMVALMSHYTLYTDDPFDKMGEYCMEYLSQKERDNYSYIIGSEWKGRVVGSDSVPVSIATVHAVHHLLTHYDGLMDIMRAIIDMGGDTDSVAAVAWGIASARYRYETIPAFMRTNLEPNNPATGTSYLMSLGSSLLSKYFL